jgi:hypothetical protein
VPVPSDTGVARESAMLLTIEASSGVRRMRIERTMIDALARAMAANAGVAWDMLNDYPGYTRNYWRDQAEAVLRAVLPPAPAKAEAA